MQFSQRPIMAIAAAAFACVINVPTSSQAQQPVPLRLSSPPAHTLANAEPMAQAQAQTQTAQGELLDVDAKANTLTVKTQSREVIFRFTDQTKVTGAQKGVSGLATMAGSQVTLMFQKQGSLNVASSIDVKVQK